MVVGCWLSAAGMLLQKLVNQPWMLAKSLFWTHALSQTPEVPDLNGARRWSLQKQLS